MDRGAAKEAARESIFAKSEQLKCRAQEIRERHRRGDDGEEERAAHRLEALAAVPLGRGATPASLYAAGEVDFPSPASKSLFWTNCRLVPRGDIGTPPTPPADHTIETGVFRAF